MEKEKKESLEESKIASKMIIIVVVSISFMALFHEKISELIDRITGISITKDGLSVSSNAKDHIDSIQSKADTIVDSNTKTFVDGRIKYKISWPINSKWVVGDPRINEGVNFTLEYNGSRSNGIFVTVSVVKSKYSRIRNLMNSEEMNDYKRFGTVLETEFYDDANFAYRLSKFYIEGNEVFSFTKCIIRHSLIYMAVGVMASNVPNDKVRWNEIKSILASFNTTIMSE